MSVSKTMLIADVLKIAPESRRAFSALNMNCFSCTGARNETLEKGCLMHGVDVDLLIAEIERFLPGK